MPTQPAPTTTAKALSGRAAHAAAVEQALHDRWVVILMDPDHDDWSPWPVVANNKAQAILRAQSAWRKWCGANAAAEIVKVYSESWIGERA